MLVRETQHGFSSRKKLVHGKGFMDSLSSVFRNQFIPTLQNIGSYVSRNKDLLAKPLIGAVGNLAATGLELAGRKALNKLLSDKQVAANKEPQLDAKSKEILESMMNLEPIPVTNIMGSGIMKF
jgi:hypothetical protein